MRNQIAYGFVKKCTVGEVKKNPDTGRGLDDQFDPYCEFEDSEGIVRGLGPYKDIKTSYKHKGVSFWLWLAVTNQIFAVPIRPGL